MRNPAPVEFGGLLGGQNKVRIPLRIAKAIPERHRELGSLLSW